MKRLLRSYKKLPIELCIMVILIMMGYVCLHDFIARSSIGAWGSLFGHEPLDSYTLQAIAWLKGQNFLQNGQDYPWLELAIFSGKYYVSFPPVPTLILLPLVPYFKDETPNNLLIAIYAIMAVIGAYRACRIAGMNSKDSCFWSLFIVLGSNMVDVSADGGVWYQAQALNMALLVWGIDCALRNRRVACMILLSLAIGCRPLSIIYIGVAFVYFYWKDKKDEPRINLSSILSRSLKPIIPVILIGSAYMIYNYVRFGNPLEFGHNYLPEMMDAKYGQFDIRYLPTNLYNLFCRPVVLTGKAQLSYPMFDGFMFFIGNPIFIVWIVRVVKDIHGRRMTSPMKAVCVGLIVNLLWLCMHNTLGGFQFGSRYIIDLIPYVMLYLLLSGKQTPSRWERFMCAFGVLFNVYGTLVARLYNVFSA